MHKKLYIPGKLLIIFGLIAGGLRPRRHRSPDG